VAHDGSSLRDYLRAVGRRKWVLLQAIVVVTAAAIAFSLRQEELFRASAQVLLSNQNLATALTGVQQTGGVSLQADRVAETQADLARVPLVAARTVRQLKLERTADDLLSHSSVAAKPNADLLEFSVTDHDSPLAIRLVTSYAKQFVIFRKQLDTASLERARSEVQQRIRDLESTGDTRSALHSDLLDKEQQLATMEALQGSNAALVQPATKAVKVQPKPVRNGILGFGLGLILGLGLAFLREALDTRVRNAEEISARLGLPLLARIPAPSRRLRRRNALVTLATPKSPDAEAFRMLRTNLEFVRLGHDASTIVLTSAVEQEGKSTTVANLAVALARAGQRVVLVDLDLRRPFLDRFFETGSAPGLTQVAIGQCSLDDALVPIPIGDLPERRLLRGSGNGRVSSDAEQLPSLRSGSLHLLVSGPIPPNPGEFAASDAVADILEALQDRFDIVLTDSPPVLQVGDAMALSSRVQALVVVTRMDVVRRPMLNELRRALESSPARKLGFVVAGAEREEGYGYGGYYYGSYVSESERAAAL
jgi:polysaccharide biosynthesis transport protein